MDTSFGTNRVTIADAGGFESGYAPSQRFSDAWSRKGNCKLYRDLPTIKDGSRAKGTGAAALAQGSAAGLNELLNGKSSITIQTWTKVDGTSGYYSLDTDAHLAQVLIRTWVLER